MCDLPVCFNQTTPKARKNHHCCECGSDILVGQIYERSSGVWPDSGAQSFKTCLACANIRVEVLRLAEDETFDCVAPFGGLYFDILEWMELSDLLALNPPSKVLRMLFKHTVSFETRLEPHEIFAARYALIDWSKTA